MIENKPTATPAAHDIALKSRKQMTVTGVKEVISFDEQAVNLRTVCGDMAIEGEGLHIGVLDMDRGVVSLDGTVNGVWYLQTDRTEKKGFLGKLLK